MSGRIIFKPEMPSACDRGQCDGKPRAADYRVGTIWECDHCGRQWIVWSGAQYNEPFSAWKLHSEPPLVECPHWVPGSLTLRRGCTACASETGGSEQG